MIDPPFVTKSGKVLTDADFEALADEAQEGWTEATDAEKVDAYRAAVRIMVERAKRAQAVAAEARKVVDMWRRGDPDEIEAENWSEFDHLILALDSALVDGER